MAAAVISNDLGIPVVYVTAHSDPKTVERAKRTNPSGYLVKPLDQTRLRPAIEKALEESVSERRETSPSTGKGTIRLIDGSNQIQSQVLVALGRGYRVKIASSIAVATQMLGDQDFDLIMVDIAVSDGGSQGVVRKLRREFGVIAPIIALGEKLDPSTIPFLKPDVAGIVSKAAGFASRVKDEVGLILKNE